MSQDGAVLARRKEDQVSGGNVNYYLVIIPGKNGDPDIIVEVEDIIKFCRMDFAAGCVFKALVRICKLRQDLGKPGSTSKYESEKISYYADRTHELTQERIAEVVGWRCTFRFGRDLLAGGHLKTPETILIDIRKPKRLTPYAFVLGDFVDALEPTRAESAALVEIMTISLMRQVVGPARKDEIARSCNLVFQAQNIKSREKLSAMRAAS